MAGSAPGNSILGRTLRDTARFYRQAWWRVAAVTFLTGVVLAVALFALMKLATVVITSLRSEFVHDGRLQAVPVAVATAAIVAVFLLVCLPILLAGMAAVVRVTDDQLSGRRPQILRSFVRSLWLGPQLFVSGVIAGIVLALLVIAAPLLSALGLVALIATPAVRLAARRWPVLARRWPSVRSLVWVAVPFGLAVRWLAQTLLFLPAAALGQARRRDLLRRASGAASGRRPVIVGLFVAGLVASLVIEGGLTYMAFLLWSLKGAAIGQGAAQLVFLALPVVILTVLFRLSEASKDGGLPTSTTAAYAVGAGPAPMLADVAMVMLPSRRTRRRVAVIMPAVLLLAGLAGPIATAQADGFTVIPAGSITLTVNSAADDTDSGTVAAESANCLAGSGTCTLRAAIAEASSLSNGGVYGAITITFSGDTAVDVSANSPLTFNDANGGDGGDGGSFGGRLTIDASGHNVTIDGQGASQDVVLFSHSWSFTLRDLEIKNGVADAAGNDVGGGLSISGAGTNALDADTFDGNEAADGGGAVYSSGVLTVVNSTFADNSVGTDDDDIPNGGADLYNSSHLTVNNSTFANSTNGSIFNFGTAGYTMTVDNSLFAISADTANGHFDCTGQGISGLDNVITHGDTTCPGSIADTGPSVGPLARVAQGTPPVYSLAMATPGNPVNAAQAAGGVGSGAVACAGTDERGAARPSIGCDAGAYQYVATTTTTVSSDDNPAVFGDSVDLTAAVRLSHEAVVPRYGSVQFSIDGAAAGGPVTLDQNGNATYSTTALTTGSHQVSAVYTSIEPTVYSDSQTASAFTQTVNAGGTLVTVASSANPAPVGTAVGLTVTATGGGTTPTGTITVLDMTAGTPGVALVTDLALDANGTATVTTSTLTAGDHQLVAKYSGDANNAASTSAVFDQDVQALSSLSVTAVVPTAIFGTRVGYSATVASTVAGVTPTGWVDFTYTATDGTHVDSEPLDANGTATETAAIMPAGTDGLSAKYRGDASYGPSSPVTASVRITPAATSGAVSFAPAAAGYGVPVAVSAVVTNTDTSADPAGSVAFSTTSGVIGTAALVGNGNGTSTATYTTTLGQLPVGDDAVAAAYTPSADFAGSTPTPSSITIGTAPTAVALSSDANPAAYGQALHLTATVTATGGSTAIPSGTVTFTDGITALGSAVLANGVAVLGASTLDVGAHSIIASFAPAGAYDGSTSSALSQSITSSATTTTLTVTGAGGYGATVGLSVAVAATSPGGGTPTGTVTITDGGTVVATSPLVGGEATADLVAPAIGVHHYLATYSGNTSYGGSTSASDFIVTPASTSTALTFDQPSSVIGDPVTMSATVTDTSLASNLAPAGTVTFSYNGTVIGTADVTPTGPTTGVATLTTTALPQSSFYPHGLPMLAQYNPTPNFTASADNQYYDVAQGIAAVTLSAGPASVGSPLTLTSTVTAATGQGSPAGMVIFTENGEGVGQATVVNGVASISGLQLRPGDYVFIATFYPDTVHGDFDFVAGNPAVINIQLGQGVLPISISQSAAGPIAYGATDTLTSALSGYSGPITPGGTVTFFAVGPQGTTALGAAPVLLSGQASLAVSNIPGGAQSLVASYSGDADYAAVSSAGLPETVTAAPTLTTVTATSTPSYINEPILVVARVTDPSTGMQPTGTVTFTENGQPVGLPISLNSFGQAVYPFTPSAIGTDEFDAVFTPADADFASSDGSLSQSVIALPDAVQLTSASPLLPVGVPTTVNVLIDTSGVGQLFGSSTPPRGDVVVSDAAGPVCTAPLAPGGPLAGDAVGSCQAIFATAGSQTLTATYEGDDYWAGATSQPLFVLVQRLAPTVSFTADPAVTGMPSTVHWSVLGPRDGTVTVSLNGTVICTSSAVTGSCTYTYPFNFRSQAELTLQYSGNAGWLPAQASTTQTVTACVPFTAPTVSPAGAGTITTLTAPNCDNGTGYLEGSGILYVETPAPGWSLNFWLFSDGHDALTQDVVRYPGPTTEMAYFNVVCTPVSFGGTNSGGLSQLVRSSVEPNCGPLPHEWTYNIDGSQTGLFVPGTTITLTEQSPPTPASGIPQVFANWSGEPDPTTAYDASITFRVPTGSGYSIYSHYANLCYHGITFPAPAGGTATLGPTNCSDRTGAGYLPFSRVAVSTKPIGSAYFTGWFGSSLTTTTSGLTGATGVLTITGDQSYVRASYNSCVQLTAGATGVLTNGNQMGSATATPTGNCPNQGAGWYTPGSLVVLKASPTWFGVNFVGWTGPVASNATFADNYVIVNGPTTVAANFNEVNGCQPLTLTSIPPGSTTISTSFDYPPLQNCPAGQYDQSAAGGDASVPLTLTATATGGNPIIGFTGTTSKEDRDGNTPAYNYTGTTQNPLGAAILGPSSFTAWACEYVDAEVTLISPNGTRHTSPAPSGADFVDATPGPDCPIGASMYTVGQVTFPAANAPTDGYSFAGWSGAITGTNPYPTTPVVLDGTTKQVTITATYNVKCYALSSNFDDLAVSPAPNCPDAPAGSHSYIGGTVVTFQATGHGDDVFRGWTGDGTAAGAYAYVTMDADHGVYADYTAKSVGEKITAVADSVGNDVAIGAKKLVGVVSAVVGGLVMGDNPITAIGGLVVLLGEGVQAIANALGVSSAGLTAFEGGILDISEMLTYLNSTSQCATVWAAAGNSDSATSASSTAEGQAGSAIAKDALTTQQAADKAAAQAAQDAAIESAYDAETTSLVGQPFATTTVSRTQAALDALKANSTVQSVSAAADDAKKLAGRLGPVAAVGGSIYSEVSNGSGSGWDSSASAAWTGGGDAYMRCMEEAVPPYFGLPPAP